MSAALRKIAYVVADLRQVGPTNQTLNIIRFSGAIENCVVITLFDEGADTLIDEYRNYGIPIICLHLSRKRALFQGISKLCNVVKEMKINIIHSYGTFADIISHYSCKKLKIKHIITLRNFPMEDMTKRYSFGFGYFVALLVLYILKKSQYVICCSNSIKDKMKEAYGWNNLYSIQNGVDFEKFKSIEKKTARRMLNINNEDFIYISTGSIISRKRIDETIEAFQLAALNSKSKLWIVGEGDLLDKFKRKYQTNKNIIFWGKQSDVVKYLSAADVFVSSSESEGMPNAVLEAISCNLPVVLSNIPQHLEIFKSLEGCGKSYELGNKKQLADIFISMNDVELKKMKESTNNILYSVFTMENMGKKYAKFYRTL